jgi:tetratricopeptide (TPR) repeat protein
MTDQAENSSASTDNGQSEVQDKLQINHFIGTNADKTRQADASAFEGEVLEPLIDLKQFSVVVSRVELLTAAIEHNPDAPSNYVFRGEILLDGGDYDLAAEDFRKALQLAEDQAETANWGYIYRALADRAREGLRRAGA